jgi:hypothetical protein
MLLEREILKLSKESMKDSMKESDFGIYDFRAFASILDNIMEIGEMKLKPHLIIWHSNMWMMHLDYLDKALELLGYEYVGRMNDLNEDEFRFESKDNDYDTLYRFKDKKCDYTQVLRFGE